MCGEWRQVPDSNPKNACGQLECDQRFIDEPSEQLVAHLREACSRNASRCAKPKSSISTTRLIYKRALCKYLWRVRAL